MKYEERLPFKVGIVGGGVAGATAALKMAGLGIKTHLFEAKDSLVSGPPICHLHAGGNLYRELSKSQCIALLEQSIATLHAFPDTVNYRPTVIAIPATDPEKPGVILARLKALRQHYHEMVMSNPENEVLGKPDDYFKIYHKEDILQLANRPLPQQPATADDWVVPVARFINHEQIKFPLFLVQEFGLSIFRLAATASIGLEASPNTHLHLNHRVVKLAESSNGWTIESHDKHGQRCQYQVDFLINACGFQTGTLDNIANRTRKRWVEYKAAYIAHWPSQQGVWPEVIVHGERGTPNGMAQFTPYPQGFIQLHGMTKDITLFEGGLVASDHHNAQPCLPDTFLDNIKHGWQWADTCSRTERAITHFSQWVPEFNNAEVGGNPLCGAQQIPGDDPALRAADVSFDGLRYARLEIVKASSALYAAQQIIEHCKKQEWIELPEGWQKPSLPLTNMLDNTMIIEKAKAIAKYRGYPEALAQPFPAPPD